MRGGGGATGVGGGVRGAGGGGPRSREGPKHYVLGSVAKVVL